MYRFSYHLSYSCFEAGWRLFVFFIIDLYYDDQYTFNNCKYDLYPTFLNKALLTTQMQCRRLIVVPLFVLRTYKLAMRLHT